MQNSSTKDLKSIITSELPHERKTAETQERNDHVGKIKVPRKCFAVLDTDTITNLKEWTVAGNLLILIGGIFEGGCFLFFQAGIDKIIPTAFVAAGILAIVLGVLVEQRKFKHFVRKMKEGKVIGELHFIGEGKSSKQKRQRCKQESLRTRDPFVSSRRKSRNSGNRKRARL